MKSPFPLALRFETHQREDGSWFSNAYLNATGDYDCFLASAYADEPAKSIQDAEDAAYLVLEAFVKRGE